jgi:hypothetical protein
MKAHRIGLPAGVRNRIPNGKINIHDKRNTHPCQARGKPQPKP